MGDEESTTPYSNITGDSQPPGASAAAPGPNPQYGPMTNPTPDISSMQRPPANAQELEVRKQGWNQVLQNPNFMRALGVMGAHMMQPVQPGQTRLGQLGTAGAAGMTAMQMGDYADYEKDMAAKKEGRAQVESVANVAGTQARTNLSTAALPGTQARSNVEVATQDTQIDEAKQKLKAATTSAEVGEIEKKLKQRRADIESSIPDEALRAAERSKVDAAILAVDEARARLASTKAGTAAKEVDTKKDQITLDTLNSMAEPERKEFLTKTGRYSTHVSSLGNAASMYGSIYDNMIKVAPNDPRIKGKSREQFMLDGVQSQKKLDASTSLKNYMAAIAQMPGMEPDAEIVSALAAEIKSGAQARAGTPDGSTTTPAATAGAPVKVSSPAEYQKLPTGTRYIDPTGKERVKQ